MLNLLNKTKNLIISVRQLTTTAATESVKPSTPALIIPLSQKSEIPTNIRANRQAWIENTDTVEEKKLGLIELHPDVFATNPRVDVIQENIEWQRKYRYVSFAHTKSRSEVRGGGRKPWPQKGGGRSRHSSIRSPLFKGGGIAHGPRSPTTHFYMLPFYKRVMGLTSTLSVKLAQDDLHIVRDLDIPSRDPNFIKDLIKERNWGPSVLVIDNNDIFPENICYATNDIGYVNLMPVYGLNTYSMLKHDTLVLTVAAVKQIVDRILYQLTRRDARDLENKFKTDQ
ncbi:39S ribosomal protein L4, mitochondrial [Eupeodes corollae]|uniref:39S ribosomal protein L4, mitochondrial n=1 Tax=Eupeodes corollae TaxID=290404 RepID=UPI00249231C6|nr:39S ribosomal protein L4, mitochondrial [Eupeodes corollae]